MSVFEHDFYVGGYSARAIGGSARLKYPHAEVTGARNNTFRKQAGVPCYRAVQAKEMRIRTRWLAGLPYFQSNRTDNCEIRKRCALPNEANRREQKILCTKLVVQQKIITLSYLTSNKETML